MRETCEYLDFICNDWHVACLQLPASMNILRSVCDNYNRSMISAYRVSVNQILRAV